MNLSLSNKSRFDIFFVKLILEMEFRKLEWIKMDYNESDLTRKDHSGQKYQIEPWIKKDQLGSK